MIVCEYCDDQLERREDRWAYRDPTGTLWYLCLELYNANGREPGAYPHRPVTLTDELAITNLLLMEIELR